MIRLPRTERVAPWRAIGYASLGVLLLMTSCSGSDEPEPEPTVSDQLRELDPTPLVAHPPDSIRPDRDAQAVTAALWRLDPCRLIAPEPGQAGLTEQDSPHSCTLDLGSAPLRIEIGEPLVPMARYGMKPRDVAGAKAYVLPSARSSGGCLAWLPVSFTDTIRFSDDLSECRRVVPLLRRVVRRIDDERGRQTVPGLASADTCTLLRVGLGPDLSGRKVAYGSDAYTSGIDECVAIPDDSDPARPSSRYASLEVETHPEGTAAGDEWATDFGMIGGRSVYGDRTSYPGTRCTMRWAESTTILQLDARSCADARRMVTSIMRFIDEYGDDAMTPQQPILYRPDQPDHASRGACVDYMPLHVGQEYEPYAEMLLYPPVADEQTCHRYLEPSIPDGGAETVAAAEADPNVTCAISKDAVGEAFGRRLRPATLEAEIPHDWPPLPELRHSEQPPLRVRPCVFSDPRRQIQVQVYVSADPMPLSPFDIELLEEFEEPTRTSLNLHGIGSLIGLGEHPDDPGYVAVFVGGRVLGAWGAVAPAPEWLDELERVADTIIEDHLSEAS